MHAKKQFFGVIGRASLFFIVFLGLAFFVRTFMFEVGIVDGQSMYSTYHDNERFLVSKIPLFLREPKRGDIVQLIYKPSKSFLVKRVIGLPGETLIIKRNAVFLVAEDGTETQIDEPYLDEFMKTLSIDGYPTTYGPFKEHEYFVMGDNRMHSRQDSRLLGPIPRQWILGLAGIPLRVPSLSLGSE